METVTLNLSEIGGLTDDELVRLCESNRELRIERTSKGELVIMSPSMPPTGRLNSILNARLFIWNDKAGLGEVFDSNSGFTLPNTAMRAADVAWITKERWAALPEHELHRFSHICPDFVIELMSESDRLVPAQEKMEEWMDNGCRLGWLVVPKHERVYVYRANGERSTVEGFDNTVSGEDVLPGFVLELRDLR